MARTIPASVNSGTECGPRGGATPGCRSSRVAGGIERAGATRTGRAAATWRVGIGFGIGSRIRALAADAAVWVLRAGVLARARLTVAVAFESFDTCFAFLLWLF